MNLSEERDAISELAVRLDSLQQSIQREENNYTIEHTNLAHAQKAQEILQHLAQAVQAKAHEKIAEVVSSCLASVFDSPYLFTIRFERKRGRTEAYLRFQRGAVETDPMRASGGGTVDVAAFALRVASLVLHRPRLAQVIVLDEPMKFVSEKYQVAVRSMLEQLAEDMNIQIIFVTHNENYSTGKVIDLE